MKLLFIHQFKYIPHCLWRCMLLPLRLYWTIHPFVEHLVALCGGAFLCFILMMERCFKYSLHVLLVWNKSGCEWTRLKYYVHDLFNKPGMCNWVDWHVGYEQLSCQRLGHEGAVVASALWRGPLVLHPYHVSGAQKFLLEDQETCLHFSAWLL